MNSFNIRPLIDKFNEYVEANAEVADASGAKQEFSALIKSVFSNFVCAKASKEALIKRKEEHDSFLRVCDTLHAAEDPDTCIVTALAYSGRASVEQALGELDAAAADFRRSADVAAGEPEAWEVRFAGVINLASTRIRQKQPEAAAKVYAEALRLLERSNAPQQDKNKKKMALLSDYGSIYCRLAQPQRAKELFDEAVQIYDTMDDSEGKMKGTLIKCLANRSGVLVSLKDYDGARRDGRRAMELEGDKVSTSTTVTLTNLAAACKCLERFDEAEAAYGKAIMLKTALGGQSNEAGRIDIATLMIGRGETRMKMGKDLDAQADLSLAIDNLRPLAGKYGKSVVIRLTNALKLRSELYSAQGRPELAEKDDIEREKLTGNALD